MELHHDNGFPTSGNPRRGRDPVRGQHLPCRQLPTYAEAQRVVEAHQEVIDRIEKAGGGVRLESHTCPGETEARADILIWYPSHRDRVAIEGIINGETFFGIPYRLLNN